jgi:hypothetical protein
VKVWMACRSPVSATTTVMLESWSSRDATGAGAGSPSS